MPRLLERICNVLSIASLVICAALVAIMALMVGLGAVARYTIAKPFPMVDEFGAYMLVAITYIGAGYVLRERGHIKIDVVTKMLPRIITARLAVATDLLSILTTIGLIIMTAQVVAGSWRSGATVMGLIDIPMGPVQLLMPIGLSLLLIQFLYVLSASVKSALRQPEAKEQLVV